MNTLFPSYKTPNITHRITWSGLTQSVRGLLMAMQQRTHAGCQMIITQSQQHAHQYAKEIQFYCPSLRVSVLPDWETLPYDHFSPHNDITSARLTTLSKLTNQQIDVFIVSVQTLLHRLPPKPFIISQSFVLQCGDTFNIDTMRHQFISQGYHLMKQVYHHGEFAIRGAIIDIFPMGQEMPIRIECFDDKIDTLRFFDPDTQRSLETVTEVTMLPAQEFPIDEAGITLFRQQWRKQFSGNPAESTHYQAISDGDIPQGIQYYLPLFFDDLASLTDYLPEATNVMIEKECYAAAEQYWEDINRRYEQLKHDQSKPILPPNMLFTPVNTLYETIKPYPQIVITENNDNGKCHHHFMINRPPSVYIKYRDQQPLQSFQDFTKHFNGRVLISADSVGRQEVIKGILQKHHIHPHLVPSWDAFIQSDRSVCLTHSPIHEGFILQEASIAIITEEQLFNQVKQRTRDRTMLSQDPSTLIKSLTELTIDAPIVHIDHGVGRYRGLQHISSGNHTAEYLVLEYADNDKVYVPVTSLHRISRYTGSGGGQAPLQKLGTKQWDKIKKQAEQQIHDTAAELLELYGQREAATGTAMQQPNEDFFAFRQSFPFTETPDQEQAINDVIADMTSHKIMDRLVCGDVGFGKTEVAMQAAFLAVQSNLQVAVLTPTTLLCAQHGKNFMDRFADWPINIAILSRLQTKKEQNDIIKAIASGDIDIVIGTHKLLSDDIQYRSLGLLVVDEEHRFGVRQKEKIKAMRHQIDILTLTATPIPRTLNMSLAGTRDLSIIATPPAQRRSVRTFVHEWDPSLIREAFLREAHRGGQTYFLHNDVSTIETMAATIQSFIPEAKIKVAHGQMHERTLEKTMLDFHHKKFNVLIASTIIESGIDIPSANTMIIHRADKLGLAQLHQLRGRVGRSHHQAYAYLLTPKDTDITADAKKRLDAIQQLEDLGSGFMLATHDMEIRGAGELLAEEQSGQMHTIGFSLYMELLEDAVKALQKGDTAPTRLKAAETTVDTHETAIIPEAYIGDVQTRLSLYKRLSACQTDQDRFNIQSEMIDRFGRLPDVTERLFVLSELRCRAEQMGIVKIDVGRKKGVIQFSTTTPVSPQRIIQLIQQNPKEYQLIKSDTLQFLLKENNENDNHPTRRTDIISALLEKLDQRAS